MNYCKIFTYFALVEGVQELVSDKGVTYRANDWDAIEHLHDSMTDTEIYEIHSILMEQLRAGNLPSTGFTLSGTVLQKLKHSFILID